MSDLNLIICMKVVPKPEEIRVNPETHLLEREGARSEFNPPDMNALEMALSLRDRHGGKVTVLSMGPPFFESYLRIAAAMGADELVLLSDARFAGADTLATTYTLAKGIQKLGGGDIILCGEESSDGATGQVPPGLAEWLDLPQMTLLTKLTFNSEENVLIGRREIHGGYELQEAPLPVVVSVKTASNEPRFIDYRIKDWAFNQVELTVWDFDDLNAEDSMVGLDGSPTTVTGLDEAPSRARKREFLQGELDDVVRQLTEILETTL
jgi:electron transfer flavoprotein beta subunit